MNFPAALDRDRDPRKRDAPGGSLYNIVSRIRFCEKIILSSLAHIPESDMKEILMLKDRLVTLETKDSCRDSFMDYIRYIWDGFIEGEHHRLIADKLTEVAQGKCKRLIVNMPPRHTKSEFASVYFPSWIMGLKPDTKIMQTTHTQIYLFDLVARSVT